MHGFRALTHAELVSLQPQVPAFSSFSSLTEKDSGVLSNDKEQQQIKKDHHRRREATAVNSDLTNKAKPHDLPW